MNLHCWTVSDLTKTKGIGEAKAITIVAALELGRRRKELIILEKPKITSSKDAYRAICKCRFDGFASRRVLDNT